MKKIIVSVALLVIVAVAAMGFVATSNHGAHAAPALSKAVVLAQAKSHHHQSNHLIVSPRTVIETTDGNVSFAILGQGLIPHQSYFIDSPTLDYACGFNVSNLPTDVTTDFEGRLNVSEQAQGCIAGTYQIYAQDDNTPFTVYQTSVTIKTP